ncbi:hypothetical protein BCR41DRAFT_397820 [Lobosporangium transversale]|uniref:Uncharacterized protein n=1 Tax=Lobosporangium transversale TaxID=64571 RepID=A0A1Y2GIC9_9FUNG|nr:hypothetical protein BCR41DRAFT_397820 [Lobosporangium transversale]ORZ11669.1 hypothetical protein BCR41DRAFT_397820 [Lobosporangium transversale]|eukprot:XP_021879766.1 hypothetical protein BCR41DRAFT_397820 [Lobosporangium transversale]
MKKQQKGLQSHFKRQEKRKQKTTTAPDDQQQMQTQKQKSKRHFFKNRVKPQKHQTRPSPIMDEKEESEGIDGQRSRWHNKIKRWVLLKKSAKAEIPSVTTAIVLEPNRTEVVNREYEGKANEIGATATLPTHKINFSSD